jgi:hypothetical protein
LWQIHSNEVRDRTQIDKKASAGVGERPDSALPVVLLLQDRHIGAAKVFARAVQNLAGDPDPTRERPFSRCFPQLAML